MTAVRVTFAGFPAFMGALWLTGRARSRANLKPFVEGRSANKSGRPKDRGRFGEILMKEFYRTVIASMGGKTVKKTQGEIVAQQMVRRGGGWRTTATHIKTVKFHDDQVKTIDAAIEKAKATSGTSVDSAALELIWPRLFGAADVAGAAGRVGSRSSGQDVRQRRRSIVVPPSRLSRGGFVARHCRCSHGSCGDGCRRLSVRRAISYCLFS